jgi:hypothetical protein
MAEKTTREDIKKIIGFMILAYPNYHPDLTSQPNAVDALFELLGDIESEKLDAAVRKACKEPGRVFAPSVGEILGSAREEHHLPTVAELEAAGMI